MVWTNIPKPSVASYTNVNPQGREEYDQADVIYDDADVFYDGVNQGAYTKVSKPVSSVWTKIAKPV